MSAPMTPDREQEIAETAAHLYEYVPSGNSRWDWLAGEAVPELLTEVDRLRARVAELEAGRTTAAADRDKQIIAWLEKKAREEGTSNKDSRVRATATYRLADKLSRGAVRPACPPVSPEDPHDSPLHHSYALGRDLPEVTPTCTAPHSPSCSCASGEYQFCGASLGRDEYPFTCNRRVAHEGPCSGALDEAVSS